MQVFWDVLLCRWVVMLDFSNKLSKRRELHAQYHISGDWNSDKYHCENIESRGVNKICVQ